MTKNALVAGVAALMIAAAVSADDAPPSGGSALSQRPPAAPVISQVDKDAAWYARGLTGIAPPYPQSLRFLEDQGNWYTPFTRRGMGGRYDIRGWGRQPRTGGGADSSER